MKKVFTSLPVRLLIGVVLGIIIGLMANEPVMLVVVSIKYVLKWNSYKKQCGF